MYRSFCTTSLISHRMLSIAVSAIIAIAVYTTACTKSGESQQKTASSLPSIKEAPAFSGTNALGKPFESSQLRGSVWLAYFFFTSCGGPCPAMNARVESLQKAFAGNNVRFVGISVDPDTDTPSALNAYGKRYNADWTRWQMLQMPLDSVKSIAVQGFMLAQGAENDPNLHSTRLVLVDKRGMIRGYFDGLDDNEAAKLSTSITAVLAE
jgi:protein SCO1